MCQARDLLGDMLYLALPIRGQLILDLKIPENLTEENNPNVEMQVIYCYCH